MKGGLAATTPAAERLPVLAKGAWAADVTPLNDEEEELKLAGEVEPSEKEADEKLLLMTKGEGAEAAADEELPLKAAPVPKGLLPNPLVAFNNPVELPENEKRDELELEAAAEPALLVKTEVETRANGAAADEEVALGAAPALKVVLAATLLPREEERKDAPEPKVADVPTFETGTGLELAAAKVAVLPNVGEGNAVLPNVDEGKAAEIDDEVILKAEPPKAGTGNAGAVPTAVDKGATAVVGGLT